MKPIDFRNATFARIRESLDGQRAAVYTAWVVYGPGTTRGIAAASGIDLLTFRPRTTELYDCGLVAVVGREDGEGVYAARPAGEWEDWRGARVSGQQMLM